MMTDRANVSTAINITSNIRYRTISLNSSIFDLIRFFSTNLQSNKNVAVTENVPGRFVSTRTGPDRGVALTVNIKYRRSDNRQDNIHNRRSHCQTIVSDGLNRN